MLTRKQSIWSPPIFRVRTQERKPSYPKVQDGFHFGTSLAVSQVQHMYFYKLNNSTAKYLPKISGEIFPCRDLYEMDYGSCIHHTQPKCPSVDECIKPPWSVHFLEYSPAIKSTTTWMNLKCITWGKCRKERVGQTERVAWKHMH